VSPALLPDAANPRQCTRRRGLVRLVPQVTPQPHDACGQAITGDTADKIAKVDYNTRQQRGQAGEAVPEEPATDRAREDRSAFMLAYLLLAFVVIPAVELFLIIRVGHWLGAWDTAALILATGLLGGWLARQQGLAAWRQIRDGLRRGILPAAELFDGFLVLMGGALLITPGFLTDTVGFALMVPWMRRRLADWVRRRVGVQLTGGAATGRNSPSAADAVIDVEAHSVASDEESHRPENQ
jgi:UPF0716 protein FxsA